ncbi:DUF6328 family protein [Lysinimonas soli]|uniref:DUF6328 family protein n=1 Tax=Lysinimonas soli TaxID=1074233 RepID=A0ABW0NMU8_9MICO
MSRAESLPEQESPPGDGRHETELQRLDRNWTELLQELRVLQTGTQIFTGFLLAIAFQPRFTQLDPAQLAVYLTLVSFSSVATVLALTPVAMHRALFHRHEKRFLVGVANVLLRVALVVVAITLSGTALLIFDVVVGRTAGIAAGVATAVLSLAAWLVLPMFARPGERPGEGPGTPS